MQNKNNSINKFTIIFVWAFLISTVAFPKDLLANDFIQTFIVKYGNIIPNELAMLAKYDMIDGNRFLYDDIDGNTWAAIKAINPNTEIFLYQTSRARDDNDKQSVMFLNDVGRWNISRNHSMGSLNINNPELFLLDSNSNRIFTPAWSNSHLMDVGSNNYINYWLEATIHDLANQPWTADGVFIDVVGPRRLSMNKTPVKYKSNAEWSSAMQKFLNAITIGLNKKNLKLWGNTEYLKTEFDVEAYISLDKSANPPYALMNEGAFAVEWGTGDVQFYPESLWKLQVNLLSQIHNIKITYLCHSDLKQGQSGTDNWGKPVTFWDALWYAMGSFHLGKNVVDNNSYFGFSEGYNTVTWYDEYDRIDLGNAVGGYSITNYGGKNIYWREFERGYVYVNPTNYSVSAISLPKKCKQLTHNNFKNDHSTLASINTINLKGHRAAFLLKETYDDDKHFPPASPSYLRVNP